VTAPSRHLARAARRILTRFPNRATDPNRIAEFVETFGEPCANAANAVLLVSDTLKSSDLASLAERVALTVTDAIKTAALQVGVAESPWLRQGQRWAVEAYFARIAEVRITMVPGGRA